MNNDPLQIRQATNRDIVEIQACAREAYSVYLERMGREPAPMNADFASQVEQGKVTTAFYESAFAGYVVYYEEGDHFHLENVAVSPTYAGKGIGKNLIAFVENAARQRELSAVELYTNEAMTENLKMYPSLGYVEIGRRREDGFNRVFFRKTV